MPNKIHEDEEELSFEDKVLTMLADLQHHTVKFRETADDMNGIIRDFRTPIAKPLCENIRLCRSYISPLDIEPLYR